MRFLLLIYSQEAEYNAYPPERTKEIREAHYAAIQEGKADGVLIDAQRLEPVKTAQSLVLRNGDVLLSDGPFAETKEQLGGFYYLEAASQEEAVAWARKLPLTEHGTIEIRQVMANPME